jgi:hypothetical protein
LALRPRLSPGLRFSYELFLKRTGCEEASDGIALAAEGEQWRAVFAALERDAHFGSLAIIATFVALDPFALRPWLSPSLPFRLPPLYKTFSVKLLSFQSAGITNLQAILVPVLPSVGG